MERVDVETACPHCGSPDVMVEYEEEEPSVSGVYVACAGCGSQGPVEAWRRACVAAIILKEYEQTAHGRLRVEKMMGHIDLAGTLNEEDER